MNRYVARHNAEGRTVLEVPDRGVDLLRNPTYNKGSAFTYEERCAFGLLGLLPGAVSNMDQQAERAYANLERKQGDLERYIGLAALQDRNEQLFCRVLLDHLEEFLPIVYTPTVGLACQQYSHIFRRARGLWITPGHRDQIDKVLENAPFEDVRLIVVTDNERILGLGDQGAGGMGIPVGKLALYTVAAGIPPWRTLPVSLDVGTDNRTLLDDELYLGWRHERLRGEEYDSLVEEFVRAVTRRFPKAILQWEDFKKDNAFRLQGRYRKTLPSFNDDIQGTAAVVLAAILGACQVTEVPLKAQRILILGAGAAGIGIARLLREALKREGLGPAQALRHIAVLDSRGLLVDDSGLREAYKREMAWAVDWAARMELSIGSRDLRSVVRAFKPTVLVGTSGTPGAFPEDVVRDMAAHVDRPLILPLSNPTQLCEAVPEDLLKWTNGRALVATGSPFGPVLVDGKKVRIGQANNAFVFPGVGLGAMVSGAREITDGMFSAAATALFQAVSPEDLASGTLFPPVGELRRVTARVAEAVAREAREAGVGWALPDAAISASVVEAMWEPRYLPYVPAGQLREAVATLAPAGASAV
jgi:malic enzyme